MKDANRLRFTIPSGVLVAALASALLLPHTSPAQQQKREKLGGVPAQERITREVRHELIMLPYYTLFDFMAFKVEGSKVILLGKVTRPSLKSGAESVVKKIEGVESVENRIEVLPPSPFDERIRLAEYRAIYGSNGLSRYAMGVLPAIHIIVDRGHVTLEGTVDTEADKNLAAIRAKGVPDVFSVTSNLAVANPGKSK